ncbi:MAG TPA: 5'-nucleotidase C-terminal domain-containing protein [Ilumatobacter sp.]|nr:5'-nucleotidase C-terminal domain-containing protein [Ilumatobacter sp.]
MHMRRSIRLAAGLTLGVAGVVPVALGQPAQAAPEHPLTVNLLHINDHHSHLDAQSGSVDLGTSGGGFDYEMGGWGRVDAMFKDLYASVENPIKIHAGDAITGTAYYTLFKGAADAAMMNQTCFDMFEVGNHEFDDGDQVLADFIDMLHADDNGTCPGGTAVLGANVKPAEGTPLNPTGDPADAYLQPYFVMDVTDSNGDTQEIGFIGLDIAQKTMASSSPLPTTLFESEVATAQHYVAELQADGIENIVLVTHYQYANDIALAAQVPGIDAIIGGDSHTLLGTAADFGPFGFEPEGPYPTEVTNADGDTVCIGQAWQYSAIVGQLELTLQDGKTQSCTGTPHLLVGEFTRGGDAIADPELTDIEAAIAAIPNVTSIAPNQDAVDLLQTYADQIDELKQQIIGTATEPLCLNRLPGDTRSAGTCATDQIAASGARADVHGGFMQQIVADAFLARAFQSDIAIQNAGGVREVIPAGDISMNAAINVLPFSNTLVELDLTGEQVVAVLEDAVANFLDDGGSDGSYPYGAAVRWNVDLTKPAGERFTNVEVRDRDSGEWSPIDPDATYTVVTNDFIARGQDGYHTFGEVWDAGDYVDTGILYTQGLVDWIEQNAPKNDEGVPQVSVPAPADFSTQSYVGPDGELMAPLNPTRITDTRPKTSPTVGTTFDGIGEGAGTVDPGDEPLVVQIGGRSVVPPTATAVSINVTATEATGEGYFTIWPCSADKPVASSVNFDSDRSIANSVIVPLAADGTVCITSGVSSAHAVVDVTGWSASSPDYTELVPARLLDTRPETSPTSGVTIDGQHRGQGIVAPGTRITLPVVGRGEVPEGTVAVAINLTSTGSEGLGYLTAWPCDTDKPVASTLNYEDHRAIANSIVVPLAADGTLCIESGVAATHIVADVTGAYAATDGFGGVTPARLADTRQQTSPTVGTTVDGVGRGNGPLAAGETLEIQVTGRGHADSLVPDDAKLAAINVTATEAAGPGYFTVWPCDQERPVASSVNYLGPIQNSANSVVVDLSATGTVCVYAGVNSAHVVADVTAFYR